MADVSYLYGTSKQFSNRLELELFELGLKVRDGIVKPYDAERLYKIYFGPESFFDCSLTRSKVRKVDEHVIHFPSGSNVLSFSKEGTLSGSSEGEVEHWYMHVIQHYDLDDSQLTIGMKMALIAYWSFLQYGTDAGSYSGDEVNSLLDVQLLILDDAQIDNVFSQFKYIYNSAFGTFSCLAIYPPVKEVSNGEDVYRIQTLDFDEWYSSSGCKKFVQRLRQKFYEGYNSDIKYVIPEFYKYGFESCLSGLTWSEVYANVWAEYPFHYNELYSWKHIENSLRQGFNDVDPLFYKSSFYSQAKKAGRLAGQYGEAYDYSYEFDVDVYPGQYFVIAKLTGEDDGLQNRVMVLESMHVSFESAYKEGFESGKGSPAHLFSSYEIKRFAFVGVAGLIIHLIYRRLKYGKK